MPDYTKLIRTNLHRLQYAEPFLPFDNPTFRNPPFQDAPYRVLIVRLSPLSDVDRSLPHLYLFHEARQALPDAYIDLAFFPGAAERQLFAQEGVPYLLGTQSLRSADEFGLVLISNSYTLELINLPYLLIHSGIPLFSSQRGPEWPILLLGGSNASIAQSMVHADGDAVVDGIFFGEGEGIVADLVACLMKAGTKGERLAQAARQFSGFWAAVSAPQPVSKAVSCPPEARFLPVTYPLLNTPEVHTANLQITYGCPAFCSFCFEGYDRKPYRELPLNDLLATARQIKRAQGNEEINLYSFNANTHQDILPLLLALHQVFDRVSLKSQRVDILQHAGYLLEAEVEADKRSFTLGIEGISERQRALLHKSLPTADIVGLLSRLFALPIREVKCFYLLTGYETEADMAEFRGFLRQLKEVRRLRNPGIRTILSFGLLIRMPFTPLQYDRLFLDEEEWRPLIGQAKSACETNGFEFRLAFDWDAYAVTQVLALGGHWLVEPVIALAKRGYCFEGTLPTGYWEELRQLLAEAGHWNQAFLGGKGPDYPFALSFVQSNVSAEFLWHEYQAARVGQDRGYCLGGSDQVGTCLGCGACVSAEQREAITQHQIYVPEAGPYLTTLRERVSRKRRLKPVYVRVRIDPALAGALPEFLEALVFQGLLARYPELTENLLAVKESLFTLRPNAQRFPPVSGETVLALKAWDSEAMRRLLDEPRAHPLPGFEVLGEAEGFQEGRFTRLQLDLYLPVARFPEARYRLQDHLHESYLPYSVVREGNLYRFEVPPKGLKKKTLLGGTFESTTDGFRASLVVGAKFDLMAFLSTFGHHNLYRHAEVRVSSIWW